MEMGLHIAVISNIIFEPYFVPLTKRLFGENTVILPIYPIRQKEDPAAE